MTDEPAAPQPRSFAVGDPVRPVIRRAVLTTMIVAVVFELYAYLGRLILAVFSPRW